MKNPIDKVYKLLTHLLPAIVFIISWEALVHDKPHTRFLFGSPRAIFEVALAEMPTHSLWIDIGTTAIEAILGLICGSTIGSLLGLLLWSNERVAKIARPYITLIGSIPIFAVAPMLIIWFGIGLLSKVFMASFAVFFVALAQAYDGACYSAERYSHYGRSLGASHKDLIFKMIVPGALRWVIAGAKISVGLALVGAFIGEFVSSEAGLGHYILTAGSLYDMPRVLFGILLLSILALIMTGSIWILERVRPHLFMS